MVKQTKKIPSLGFLLQMTEAGDIKYDVTMEPGFEEDAAAVLFKMNAGIVGPILLQLINEKYPNAAPAVNQHIKTIAEEYMRQSEYHNWLISDAVACDEVFGNHNPNDGQNG
jgi:hypothetical protein